MNERQMWIAGGLAILVFLVVTTPGWQEALGITASLDLGGYMPALVMLGFMGALVGFVLMGGDEKKES